MDIDDFKLNFRETYKTGKDEKDLSHNESMLDREFGTYPPDKLDKAWAAIRRHHKATWYPSIGQILEAMEKGDVHEYIKSESNEVFYNICKTCGTHYSMRSRLCPSCNRLLGNEEQFVNDVTIGKAARYSHNHVTCQENCSVCPLFKKNRNIRGAKCSGWGKDEHGRAMYKCDDCPCKNCCTEVVVKNEHHAIGTIMDYVKSKTFNDPHWINFYEDKEIRIGTILSYAGSYYENKTGVYSGQSPHKDISNWKPSK